MISVIGDIILDKYTFTSCARNSPEFPSAPVGVVHRVTHALGGAANVAFNVMKMGASAKLFGACSDPFTLKMIHDTGLSTHLVHTNTKIVKNRIFVNDTYYIRVDEEERITCKEEELKRELQNSNSDVIIISDYCKGTINSIAGIHNRHKVIVDTKKEFDRYSGVNIIKPNLLEYVTYMGIEKTSDTKYLVHKIVNDKTTPDILDRLDIKNMVITAGSEGAIVIDRNFIALVPTLNTLAIDVTGAGDTFIAALAIAISEDKHIIKAVDFANRAAAISVTKRGTSYVSRNEI